MTNTILETNQISKRFGRIQAVDHLNLSVQAGEVFGILGPNGSGKTTTLGMILGVTTKTSGSFSWFGQGEGHQLRKRVGAILEHPIFYPFLTAVQNLKICALVKETKNADIDGLLKMVGLYERRNDPFKTYSLGMKQRLAIAASMIADPEVLIFDEPTNGLDPEGIADIRHIILEIKDLGKTIIMASHLLDEVQKVCSHFCVLRKGEKIFSGSVEEVINAKSRVEMACEDNGALLKFLESEPDVIGFESENGLFIVEVDDHLPIVQLNKKCIDHGIILSHLMQRKSNLEEQFLSILKESDA